MVFRLQLTTFLTKSRNFPRIFSPIAPFAADSARNRYTMGPSIREIRELSTESNTAVPAYSAVEDAAPPCAAMAAVMTGSSSFPYSLISVTVCDPRRIREFALSSSPAAMAVAPTRFATVFTLPEKDWSSDTIITAAITPRLTLEASFKSGRRCQIASRSNSVSPAAKEPVSSGISSAPFSGTCGAVNSIAEAGIASANINATAKINLLITLVKSPVSVPAWQ